MDSDSRGSVTCWIEGLKEGDALAAQKLWERYFSRLISIAEKRLHGCNRESSGEDVALSAMKSVMLGAPNNRYPELLDRENLWPLLVTLTVRKSIDEVRRQRAQRRDAGSTEGLEDFHTVIGREPSPEFAARVADEMERLVNKLDDPTLGLVARRKLENFTNEEIAAELGCVSRTVIRKLKLIRQEWEAETEE